MVEADACRAVVVQGVNWIMLGAQVIVAIAAAMSVLVGIRELRGHVTREIDSAVASQGGTPGRHAGM
jgi:hypothetical protein